MDNEKVIRWLELWTYYLKEGEALVGDIMSHLGDGWVAPSQALSDKLEDVVWFMWHVRSEIKTLKYEIKTGIWMEWPPDDTGESDS